MGKAGRGWEISNGSLLDQFTGYPGSLTLKAVGWEGLWAA